MGLIALVKKMPWIQNIVGWIYGLVPVLVEHNLGKYLAIKKAFYLTALEQLEGDYFEFGVFTGSSFVFAARMDRKLRHLTKEKTKFFGYDSFQGFGNHAPEDDHPFYKNLTFAVDGQRIMNHIKKASAGSEVQLLPGFFEETLANKTLHDVGSKKARIVFIDCDMARPTEMALDYVKPGLQAGTVLMMDDYYSYRGSNDEGVAGAFNRFCARNPQFSWRLVCHYGYGGIVLICSSDKAVANEGHRFSTVTV